MTCSFNDLLHQGLLLLEICLHVKNALGTAISCSISTLLTETVSPKSTFIKNLFDAFLLSRKLGVIISKDHLLNGLLSIFHEPSIMEPCLLATWSHIHPRCEKNVLSICQVPLGIINHNERLVSRAMRFFKCWYNLFFQLLMLVSN